MVGDHPHHQDLHLAHPAHQVHQALQVHQAPHHLQAHHHLLQALHQAAVQARRRHQAAQVHHQAVPAHRRAVPALAGIFTFGKISILTFYPKSQKEFIMRMVQV